MTVQTENARGEWVPAIPGPYLFTGHTRCSCGKRFLGGRGRALRRYEEHYALHHILKPPLADAARQPDRPLLSTDDSEIAMVPDARRKAWEPKGTGYSREDFERDRAARQPKREQ